MDWTAIIIQFLLPILARCHNRTSTEDPQELLRDNYDSGTGKFESWLVNATIPATRRAVHKAMMSLPPRERRNFPRHSRADLVELAQKSLYTAMTAAPADVAVVMSAAETLPEDEI